MCEKLLPTNDPKLDIIYDATTTRPGNLFQIHKTQQIDEFSNFVTPNNNMVISGDGRYSCTSRLLNAYEREHWWIPMDHCYARPWNWRPESTFLKPTKTLFMPRHSSSKKKSNNPLAPIQDVDELVDVETEIEKPNTIYDKSRAKQLMDECNRYAATVKPEEGSDDWEENISKINWNTTQNRLFNGIVNILNTDHLARLSHTNSWNEPVARRVTVDKSVERFRKLMATVAWDTKYVTWLHQLLIDNLNKEYLGIYLDILQTLRAKLPSFVDKFLAATNNTKPSLLSFESLFPLLKRPWDPVASSLTQDKPKKLPGNPLIVVMPSSPSSSQRMLKWISLLSNLTTVVTIPSSFSGPTSHKTSIVSCLDQMFVVARNKIQDLRIDYPGRNIVLVGFGFGATLALQVAQVEQVLGVVCVGFSLLTADGKRGEQDDNLMELQCPVLFVIGQCSSTSLQEDMEDLRERMRVETGLIVVGSADDNLRISKKKKKAEGITQSIVDRCIADEIGEFISGIILSPYPPQIRQSPTNLTTDGPASKKLKTERKRFNSNTSSIDSEPPSPTPRLSRPGQINSTPSLGRPPGTKTKMKLESKWAAQGTSPSPNSSPSHPQILSTPDTSSNDSTLTDKFSQISSEQPVKKIKTLKPTIHPSSEKSTITTSPSKAKALNLQNRSLSSLLQSDIPTIIQPSASRSGASGIKVLENVKITGGINPKFLANTAKVFDMSKLSVINSKGNSGNSIVLLPDGKIKNISTNTKNPGRYITSKRQLMGNKPPKPMKKLSYMSQPAQFQTSTLPPPTNLTTQDIMDLPIIFADDNQMLNTSISGQDVPKEPEPQIVIPQTQKSVPASTSPKFMVINKQNNFIIASSSNTKLVNTQVQAKAAPKYTKIILSSKRPGDELKSNVVPKAAHEAAAKKSETDLDLENEIVANTLYKPISNSGSSSNITIITSKPEDKVENLSSEEIYMGENNEILKAAIEGNLKRSASEAGINIIHQNETSKVAKLD